jgi:hypothetical protein
MSTADDIQYPFAARKVSLRKNPPTQLQRRWIVQELNSGRETSYSLARKLDCDPSFMRTIRSRGRSGSCLIGRPGGPRALDEISVAKMGCLIMKVP